VVDTAEFLAVREAAGIAAAAACHGLLSAGGLAFAKNGGLLGYGVDVAPVYRRAAVFVAKILKGAKPNHIPIEQATTFHLVVNLRTTETLGLEIPPTQLAAADEVVE
jgi:putative tryptophan/tyrosine transport system substrate-binding protein